MFVGFLYLFLSIVMIKLFTNKWDLAVRVSQDANSDLVLFSNRTFQSSSTNRKYLLYYACAGNIKLIEIYLLFPKNPQKIPDILTIKKKKLQFKGCFNYQTGKGVNKDKREALPAKRETEVSDKEAETATSARITKQLINKWPRTE